MYYSALLGQLSMRWLKKVFELSFRNFFVGRRSIDHDGSMLLSTVGHILAKNSKNVKPRMNSTAFSLSVGPYSTSAFGDKTYANVVGKLPSNFINLRCLRLSPTEPRGAQRLDKAQIWSNTRALESDITKGIYIIPCLDSAIMSELHCQWSMVDR